MDCSLPGSSVHGISQVRVLQWVTISFSWDLPNPGTEPTSLYLLHWQVDSFPLSHQGSTYICIHTQIYIYIYIHHSFVLTASTPNSIFDLSPLSLLSTASLTLATLRNFSKRKNQLLSSCQQDAAIKSSVTCMGESAGEATVLEAWGLRGRTRPRVHP